MAAEQLFKTDSPVRDDALRATVAIAHDYLTQRGGAERVVLSLAHAFPGAPIHTSMYDASGTFPEFADLPITTGRLDVVDPFRHHHRAALPFLARSFSKTRVGADVVICSSSGWAHGVKTDGRKVVYCHNPARWLYQADRYEPGRGGVAGVGLAVLQARLRRWDVGAARSADRYVVNSSIVRDRVRDAYGIDAEIVPPPHAIDVLGAQTLIDGLEPGFLLCVSRLISYKNIDAVIDAMRGIPERRLVVVGAGPDASALQATAPSNVLFVGTIDDNRLRWLYANCAGLVSASYEDFGLTPIEAAAFGKPSALLRWGGFLDSLAENVSGLYFEEPTPVSAGEAMRGLLQESWDERAIVEHAERYSEGRFVTKMREIAHDEAHAVARAAVPAAALGARPHVAPAHPAERPLGPAPAGATRAAPAVSAMRGLATKSTIAATDLLSVAAAMIAAFFVWSHWRIDDPRNFRNAHEWLGVLSMPIWLFAISHAGLYRSRLITSRMEEVRRVGRATISAMLGVAALSSVTRFEAARLWLVLSAVFGYVALVTNRTIIRRRFQRQRRAGARLRGVVIVGTNSEALAIARSLRDDPALGYRVAGFTSDDLPPGYSFDGLGEVFGSISQTLSAVRRTNSTGALIATTAVNHDESMKLTSGLAEAGVHVELSSALRDIATRRMTIRPVGRYPIVYVEPQLRGSWRGIGKRSFDVGFATVGLLITAPVLLLAVLAIKFDGGGPVLFTQRRVGRGGVSFELRKLRTMVPDAEARLREVIERNEASWPLFKMKNDPRVTRVGQFLRRTSIDELPQLWNVLRGEMSIVGPRPAIASEADGWTPEMHARLKVRPGITGMWQVNGRSTATTEDYERLDLYYVNNWSFMSDVAIIARTIPAVLATRGAY